MTALTESRRPPNVAYIVARFTPARLANSDISISFPPRSIINSAAAWRIAPYGSLATFSIFPPVRSPKNTRFRFHLQKQNLLQLAFFALHVECDTMLYIATTLCP